MNKENHTKYLKISSSRILLRNKVNQKRGTYFAFMFLKSHDTRYICSTINPHDQSIIASITDQHIINDLAVHTLQKALDSHSSREGRLIPHSDQRAQYTFRAFTDFCKSVNAIQSMIKTGYPYDNAPMERYFNTPKNECTNLYKFQTKEALCQAVEEFAYVRYNHVRPHSYNDYRTPYQARIIE